MPQVTIHVPPRPYQGWIENGLLTRAGSVLADLLPQASRIFVVTVAPVRTRWGSKLMKSLKAAGFAPQVIAMPDGEPAKRLETVEALAEKLARLGADRKAVIIALGGGVVGDTVGLLASLYMRGIEFVQIPTTVLAQVDASIGGKTGVNLAAGKNLLGTFHHPRVVLIDPTVLKTLSDREFRAGLYEALKCGVIGNVELFLRFEQSRARILKRDRNLRRECGHGPLVLFGKEAAAGVLQIEHANHLAFVNEWDGQLRAGFRIGLDVARIFANVGHEHGLFAFGGCAYESASERNLVFQMNVLVKAQ